MRDMGTIVTSTNAMEFDGAANTVAAFSAETKISAAVIVVLSPNAVATEWVRYEVQRTLEAEQRLQEQRLIPITIDGSSALEILKDRIRIDFSEDARFMDGIHALLDHLTSLGLSQESPARYLLPLVFSRNVELETFLLDRILSQWIRKGWSHSEIRQENMRLLKGEKFVDIASQLKIDPHTAQRFLQRQLQSIET